MRKRVLVLAVAFLLLLSGLAMPTPLAISLCHSVQSWWSNGRSWASAGSIRREVFGNTLLSLTTGLEPEAVSA